MAASAFRLRPARVVLTGLILTTFSGTLLVFAASLPESVAGTAVAVLVGLLVMPLMASPVEWLVHRYLYHRASLPLLRPIYEVHHRAHHYVFFPTWRYVTGGSPRRIPVFGGDHGHAHSGPLNNALVRLSHFTFYMLLAAGSIWLPSWLLTRSVPVLLGLFVASIVVSDLMVTVHDTIHRPGIHPFIERQGWFRFLDRHHYIHHVDTEANVNFLLPLADWLFGTLRRTLTAEELERHGTWEEAKAHPVGHGEPAHEALRATTRESRHPLLLEEPYQGRLLNLGPTASPPR